MKLIKKLVIFTFLSSIFVGNSYSNEKDFEIIVPRSHRSLFGAKEAGRYEATIYCVNKFGTSNIIWDVSPDDVSKVTSNKSIFIKGRCRI